MFERRFRPADYELVNDAKRDLRALSIVELMVVCAIIVVLVGIIVPAIMVARERARRTVCVKNLQQLGMAIMMYTQDFDGHYPPGAETGGPAQPLSRLTPKTINALSSYVTDPDVLYCPGCKNRLWEHLKVYSLTSWKSARDQGAWKSAKLNGDALISYVYIPNAYDANFRLGCMNPRVTPAQKRMVIMADQFIETSSGEKFCNHDLHRSVGANVLYDDWHVKWKSVEQMVGNYETSEGWKHYW